MAVNIFTSIPVIETERLLMRGFTQNDADDIFEYASVPEVSEFLPWETHVSKDDTLEFLKMSKNMFETSDNIDWAIELKNEKKVIGGISIRKWNDDNHCADVGYVLSIKYWNKGIITEALKAVIKFGFEKLNAHRIEAHCDENNTGSYKVMEKAGMRYEGTLREKVNFKGKYVNMKFYSILKSEFENYY